MTSAAATEVMPEGGQRRECRPDKKGRRSEGPTPAASHRGTGRSAGSIPW